MIVFLHPNEDGDLFARVRFVSAITDLEVVSKKGRMGEHTAIRMHAILT